MPKQQRQSQRHSSPSSSLQTHPYHSHSYLYVNNFIDHQINYLTQPFKLDSNLIEYFSQHSNSNTYNQKRLQSASQSQDFTKKLRKALAKINDVLAAHTHEIYSKQATDNITQQVLNLEKSRKLQGATQIKSVNDFFVPVIAAKLFNSDHDLNDVLVGILALPEVKHLPFKQLRNNSEILTETDSKHTKVDDKNDGSRKNDNENDDDYESDDSVIEIENIEIKDLKTKLQQYAQFRAQLNAKRIKLSKLLKKLQYYKNLNQQINMHLYGAPVNTTNINSQQQSEPQQRDTRSIQRNLVTSQSEVFDEIAKLRVNLSKVVPKLANAKDHEKVRRLVSSDRHLEWQ